MMPEGDDPPENFAAWAEDLEDDLAPGRAALTGLRGQLLDEPLLPASLGAKELFHSNVLAWMCRRFPDDARQVFAPWLTPDPAATKSRVRREYRHMDLVIEFAGHQPLVIENKLTALPDEAQLAGYTTTALRGLGDATLVLLSLADPGWPDHRKLIAGREWRYVSYLDLAGRLGTTFWGEVTFERQMLQHEAQFAHLLHRVITTAAIHDDGETFHLEPAALATLTEVGLDDAVGKVRGAQTMRLIETAYAELGINPTWTETSLSHGEPLLSAYWRTSNGDCVGWQAQGNQWRLAMILTSLQGRSDTDISAREGHADLNSNWFDFTALRDTLGVDETAIAANTRGGPDAWQRFNPDFIYRYRRLPIATTVEDIVQVAIAYGRAAETWTWT
jgi:hypothetical protein